MKTRRTVLAVAVSLALAVPALAQADTSYLTQYGTDNYGAIEQSNGSGSYASIYQSGNGNNALYAPDGDYEGVPGIKQTDTVSTSAAVQQYGTENSGVLTQNQTTSADGNVHQNGVSNYATVYQDLGANLSGKVLQYSGTENGGHVSQYGSTYSTGTVVQSGSFNYGDISQSAADGASALIQQWGNSNSGYTYESGVGLQSAIYQGNGYWCTDSSCSSYDYYDGTGDYNYAYVNQTGVAQSSRIGQFDSDGNYATVYQYGSQNDSVILQTGDYNGAGVVQTGYGESSEQQNTSDVQQLGSYSTAYLNQNGSGNDSHILQTGVSYVDAVQAGNGNTSYVTQYGTGATYSERNIATVSQIGSGFYSSVYQSGASNVATVTQHF